MSTKSIKYKSQPLDFMIYKDGEKGDSGQQGRSVASVTRYYALAKNTPATPQGKQTAEKFTYNEITWYKSPPAYGDDAKANEHMFYEATITIYDASDANGIDYAWSAPAQATMLDVDFINSLGITAKKIDVVDGANTIFSADSINKNVKIAGFDVNSNKFSGGSGNGSFTIQTNSDLLNYTPAEHIEFNGNQYIDTGVVMNYATDAFEITTQATSSNQNGMIFGQWDTTVNGQMALYHYAGGREIAIYAGVSDGTQLSVKTGLLNTDLNKHTYKFVNNELFVDGVSKGKIDGSIKIARYTSYIGSGRDSSGAANWLYLGQIYGCKIWRNGNLIRNFKPALKDNEYCLYDACTGTFYKSGGTGRLTGRLNSENANSFNLNGIRYTRLEYIENNCTNNYIDPKINLNYEQDFTIEASFKPLGNTTTSNRCCILSSHDKSTTPSISLENYSNKLWLGINRSMEEPRVNTVYGTIIPNSKNIIKVQYTPITDASGTRTDSTVSVTVNGYTSTGNKGAFKTANLSPYIFVDATKSFSSFTVPMQLYSMKIYSNNSLIANLIPVLNESTQTPGLVNLVTGEFLPNADGDKFKYSEYTGGGLTFNGRNGDNSSYRVLEYIESTGTQYIDTGVSPTTNTIAEINFIPTGGLTENAIFGSTWAANGYFLMFYNNKIRWHSKGDSEDIGNFKVGDTVVCKCASSYIEVNGNRFTMTGTGTDTSDSIKLLGKMSYSGSGAGGIGRVKYFKIWNGSTIIRDFIPVIKDESEYGLYDVVNSVFYSNSGTDKFTGKGFAQEFTALYLGSPDAENAPFSVTNTGKLKAIDANIEGNINATSGKIGGFEIVTDVIGTDEDGKEIVGDIFKSKNDTFSLPANTAAEVISTSNVGGSHHNFAKDGTSSISTTTITKQYQVVTEKYSTYRPLNWSQISNSYHNTTAAIKITFNTDLYEYSYYIASSAESTYDYMIASKLNAEEIPTTANYSSSIVAESTQGKQLELSDISLNSISTASPTIELTNNKVVKVTYKNISKDDYFYVVYRKDGSVNSLLDTGWLILPNSFFTGEFGSLERENQIYLTPGGSTASINGESKSDWGITLGQKFGVTLDGTLHAKDTQLSGSILADGGTIGGFIISPESLVSENIQLQSTNINISKGTNSLTLGADSSKPYLQFNKSGAIYGPNKGSGFIFTTNTETTELSFKAVASYSGSEKDTKLHVTIYQEDSSGNWVFADPTKAGISGIIENVSFFVKIRGRNQPWIGPGTEISDIRELSISTGSYTTSVKLSKDYDKIHNVFFVTSSSSTATSGKTEKEFTQSLTSSDVAYSLGSIIPDSSKVTNNIASKLSLGSGTAAWGNIYVDNAKVSAPSSTNSDKKLKNTISYDISAYDTIFDALKPASYKYNDSNSNRTHLGFIAQDIQKSILQAGMTTRDYSVLTIEGDGFDIEQGVVTDEENTVYRLRYDELHALEVRQIQLLKQEIKDLKAELEELKSKTK